MKKVKWALLTMVRHPWEHGTAAQAFMNAGDEDIAILMAHEAVYRQSKDGRLAVTYHCNNITDPCVCGESVMFAYKKTGEEKYKIAAEKMLEYIEQAPATADGIQFHNTSSSMIAADCLYMVAPFYAVMGKFWESVRQVDLRFNFLWDEEKQSLNHQYDAANQRWIFLKSGNKLATNIRLAKLVLAGNSYLHLVVAVRALARAPTRHR